MPAKTTKKPSTTKPAASEQSRMPETRRLRLPPPKLFRLKRIVHPVKLPSVWYIARQAAALIWQYRWLFLGIAGVYAVLSIVFVRGLSGGADTTLLQQQLGQGFGGSGAQLAAGLSSVVTLLTSSGTGASASAGAYQIFLWIVVSLATIWALRQTALGERVRLRDAFYKGMHPLVPFILVLVVVLIQILPFLAGGGIYTVVTQYGIAVTGIEKLLWGLLFVVLAAVSVYLISSSLFALYIVTLPDMTPMRALRNARQLVRYRRWTVVRKLLFLPLALLVPAVVIMVPIVWFMAPLAAWLFFVLALICLIAVHAYMYALYRELLKS